MATQLNPPPRKPVPVLGEKQRSSISAARDSTSQTRPKTEEAKPETNAQQREQSARTTPSPTSDAHQKLDTPRKPTDKPKPSIDTKRASRASLKPSSIYTARDDRTSPDADSTYDETVNPLDFQGEVQTTHDLPTMQTLRTIENYTVLDRNGKSHPFKSLYTGHNVARRVLVIFVRHFFCGNCQEYLRTLSASITPDSLLQLPVSTFIAVIGCGSHELINTYIQETGCRFPVYADPTRRLYTELGMVRTLALGSRPAYLQNRSVAHTVITGIVQGLKQVKSGLVMKMGDQRQVGGEFLFEPASSTLDTPISTPQDEVDKRLDEDDKANSIMSAKVEEKRVTWCHRMRTTRDHAEIPELREVLGLEGDGTPIKDEKRWSRAVKTRKGTGVSMASQMSGLSFDPTRASISAKSVKSLASFQGEAKKEGESEVKSGVKE
ncbi:AhpC/TSA antioxidant enzyme-domain-containing protein [Biscogniauxia marginata]|nr:AhpC/TSA antioxidant enzyme-domain-containing protein [Biscogniauxia marginata]